MKMKTKTKCLALVAIALSTLHAFASARQLKIVHVSDLHIDRNFSTDGVISNRCHLNESIKDASLPQWGVYACDAPFVLVESAFAYLASLGKPDLVIWSGDNSPHWKVGPPMSYVLKNLKIIQRDLFDKYFKGVPVVPALGNHDVDPPDDFPVQDGQVMDMTLASFYSQYLEQGALGDSIEKESRETFKKCGYYSTHPKNFDKIKFVVLNTNLYYHNKLLPDEEVDPCGQLAWLRKELENSRDEEHVFILGHIPPGFSERNVAWQTFTPAANKTGPDMDAMTQRFVDIFRDKTLTGKVRAHFYGHTHTDSFRLFLDETGRPRGVAFIQGSLTPTLYNKDHKSVGVNPSVRVYTFDEEKGIMMDYEQHYFNLDLFAANPERSKRDDTDDDANREALETTTQEATDVNDSADEPTELPASTNVTGTLLESMAQHWKRSYVATDAFDQKDLSLKRMERVHYEMVKYPNETVFRSFYKHNTANHPDRFQIDGCDADCHRNMTCAVVSFVQEELKDCIGLEGFAPGEEDYESDDHGDQPEPERTQESTTPFLPEVADQGGDTTPLPEDLHDEEGSGQDMNDESPQAPAVTDSGATSVPEHHGLRGVAIGFCVVVVLAIAVGGLVLYRRLQRNRHRANEFLLTDSVFRYDGYAQVDGP